MNTTYMNVCRDITGLEPKQQKNKANVLYTARYAARQ